MTAATEPSEPPAATDPPSDPATGAEDATAHDPVAPAADPAVSGTEAPAGAETEAAPEFVVVAVVGVDFDLRTSSPVLQLREADSPYRTVVFPIGLAEAQAIALAIDGEHAPRPTTAELLAAVTAAAGCDVVAVRLVGTREGTVLAELDLQTPRGREVLECRPSDAVALALRQPGGTPILCVRALVES